VSIRLTTNPTPEAKPPATAQDLSRHKPLARAAHLSPAEITKRDASMVDQDAAAYDATMRAGKRLKPPGRR
jgi:hypothetical protein